MLNREEEEKEVEEEKRLDLTVKHLDVSLKPGQSHMNLYTHHTAGDSVCDICGQIKLEFSRA